MPWLILAQVYIAKKRLFSVQEVEQRKTYARAEGQVRVRWELQVKGRWELTCSVKEIHSLLGSKTEHCESFSLGCSFPKEHRPCTRQTPSNHQSHVHMPGNGEVWGSLTRPHQGKQMTRAGAKFRDAAFPRHMSLHAAC